MTPEQFIMTCVYVLAGILGLCIGSFLNVVIYRLPLGMSLSTPGSHCTTCDYSLRWYDNIPVLSYLMLGGKCRKCKQKISPRYMLVEIFTALLWLVSAHLFWERSIVYAVTVAVVLSTLVCVFFIDLEHMLIFDRFVLIILVSGIAAMFIDSYTEWYDHIIGAVTVGGLFLLIYYFALWVLSKEGLGFGDVKFMFASGLLLGWQRMLLALLVSSVSASIVLLSLKKIRGDDYGKEYPFGPFLAVGVALALLLGEPIIDWYVTLLGI